MGAQPVVQLTIQTSNTLPLLDDIDLTLYYDVSNQSPAPSTDRLNISTAGRSPGEALTLAIQWPVAVSTTGRYLWHLAGTLDYSSPYADVPFYAVGEVYVVANDASPLGAGWTFSATDRLHAIAAQSYTYTVGMTQQQLSLPAGYLRAYGSGSWRFYTESAQQGVYKSQGDPGDLKYDGMANQFTYLTPDGEQYRFEAGNSNDVYVQTGWVSPDASAQVTFSYDTVDRELLKGVATPDGALATLAYAGGLLESITAAGSRVTTVTHDSSRVATIVNPADETRSLSYTSGDRPTGETFGGVSRG